MFGYSISRYDHIVSYDGLPTRKKLEMLTVERGLPQKLHKFINDLKQMYTTELVFQHCKPFFQHEYALSKLKDEGYCMAVCSNSIATTVDLMLKRASITPYIEFALSNEDVQNFKPHPEIYQKAIDRLGVKPQNSLILEDNEHGIQAAQDSGAHLMLVNTVLDVNFTNIKKRIAEIEGSL